MCTFAPEPDLRLPDVGDGACCDGRLFDGPAYCTCWTPEYDLEQQPCDTSAAVTVREGMCPDCAYRPRSPERADPALAEDLVDVAARGRFFCHQGMRRPVRLRHPSGAVIDGSPEDYQPPRGHDDDGRPVAYRADGHPAQLCAGWAARRRALLAHHP